MNSGSVLIVDDEALDRAVMAFAMREQFERVLHAQDFGTAMDTFRHYRRTIRFLLTDVSLPDGNGCALAIAMQKLSRNLRVLFVSGRVGSEVCKYYGLEVTDLHFLSKPFTERTLVKAVEGSLNAELSFPRLHFPMPKASTGRVGA